MIIQKEYAKLELEPGDEVVAATPWRDVMFIITARGNMYTIRREFGDD